MLTSRELEYYVDVDSGEPISRWNNPWTNETVPVVHVANTPVQGVFGNGSVDGRVIIDEVNVASTYNLFYPNKLAVDVKFKRYSWQSHYESSELFSYFTPEAQLRDPKSVSARDMHFTWTRISQWLPWMAMDGLDGRIVFTASGSKVAFEELPGWLQADITTRLPLYRHAPHCYLNASSGTSWSYFAQHFEAYKRGAVFPVAAPAEKEPCMFP